MSLVKFFVVFYFFGLGVILLLSDDPLLLRLEGRHAVALELLSGPALGSGALVDDVAGHDERVLEQAGVRLHASAGEQTRARAQDRAVTDVERV